MKAILQALMPKAVARQMSREVNNEPGPHHLQAREKARRLRSRMYRNLMGR
jgi:hypothetical protein